MPVKQRFDTRVDIRGIADVSCVPASLRGLGQRRFRAAQTYPVMMSWTSDAVKAFAYTPGKADVLVLDRHGTILYRTSGKANDPAIQDLCDEIERALSVPTAPTRAK
jgi:hypothetical protein